MGGKETTEPLADALIGELKTALQGFKLPEISVETGALQGQAVLSDVLFARETKVQTIETLLKVPGVVVASFALQLAGEFKRSRRSYLYFKEQFKVFLVFLLSAGFDISGIKVYLQHTGDFALVMLPNAGKTKTAFAAELKRYCVNFEEQDEPKRLLDIDVYALSANSPAKQLSRCDLNLPERKCLICENPWPVCARSRAHGLSAVRSKQEELLAAGLIAEFKRKAKILATTAVITEFSLPQKPGLVTTSGPGSHKDMNWQMFAVSAAALSGYFARVMSIALDDKHSQVNRMQSLKYYGLLAEKNMYELTGGVNTHKGTIFHFGVMLYALTVCFMNYLATSPAAPLWDMTTTSQKISFQDLAKVSVPEAPFDADKFFCTTLVSTLAKTAAELDALPNSNFKVTAGVRCKQRYQTCGAMDVALSGYHQLIFEFLPYYEKMLQGSDREKAMQLTLLKIIADIDDTNMLKRLGQERAASLQRQTLEVLRMLEKGSCKRQYLSWLCRTYEKHNASPGGAADLLALVIFLHDLKAYMERTF